MKETFEKYINSKTTDELKTEISIVLIAHVYEPRGNRNAIQLQCRDTERFSIDEFNDIYQGIVAAGFFVQNVFFNEIDFISEYINKPKLFHACRVFNLARNGLGNNKKTLIPAFCEMVGLPYTSSSSLTCAMCRNKHYFSAILQSRKILVPKTWIVDEISHPLEGEIVIAKPCSESASQGINISNISAYTSQLRQQYLGKDYIFQEFIDGDECEVPIIAFGQDIIIFPPIGINLNSKAILDESTSNSYDYTFYDLASKYPINIISTIKDYALKTFKTLGMEIYGRVDFRISRDGTPYVFDVSTTPYTIKHSSFAYAFKTLNIQYSSIYEAVIIASAIRNGIYIDKN